MRRGDMSQQGSLLFEVVQSCLMKFEKRLTDAYEDATCLKLLSRHHCSY